MIKPRPSIGSICRFAATIKNTSLGEFIVIVQGIIVRKTVNDWYIVEIEDNWTGKKSFQDVHISHMYDFEWGGVMTLNPRRQKKIFDNLGM